MKRTAIVVGVAAAMGILAPAAAGATSHSDGLPVVKIAKLDRSLQTTHNSRSGRTMYRLGNSGLWME